MGLCCQFPHTTLSEPLRLRGSRSPQLPLGYGDLEGTQRRLSSSDCLVRPSQAVNDRGSDHFQAIVLYTEEREKAGDKWPDDGETGLGRVEAVHSAA